MDHHCPWMNNCIGINNLKSFHLFNFYVAICSSWTLIRIVVSAIKCFSSETVCETFANPYMVFICFIVGVMCVVFTLFTTVMLSDGIKMMLDETSTIDKLQRQRDTLKGKQADDIPNLTKIARLCNFMILFPVNYKLDNSVEG